MENHPGDTDSDYYHHFTGHNQHDDHPVLELTQANHPEPRINIHHLSHYRRYWLTKDEATELAQWLQQSIELIDKGE